MRKISMREAINEALHTAFNSDPSVFSIGEDIAVYGGQLRCSYDLIQNFGEKRIMDTPISEACHYRNSHWLFYARLAPCSGNFIY